ncbi:MAG: DUF3160 domain-containing protein [Deltaproteobacteria bacterium]|nr:DUF3160 domain-containing protein [Deltaproteobacteria bacterium]
MDLKKTRLAHYIFALIILTGLSFSACQSKTDSDSAPQNKDDTEPIVSSGRPAKELGTVELDYENDPIVDPTHNLPSFEDVDPEYTSVMADQNLPEDDIPIYQLWRVAKRLGLNADDDSQLQALASELRTHGVVTGDTFSYPDLMTDALVSISMDDDEPGVLLTADAIFNTFHNTFDNLLLGLEIKTLQPMLLELLAELKNESVKRYNALESGATKDAALDVVTYLQVAQSLLDPDAEMIREVSVTTKKEVALITAHNGEAASPLFDRISYSTKECSSDCDPCGGNNPFCGATDRETGIYVHCPERYCEDYSQYVPRGHYTYNETLENYFRSVMWMGRMAFLMKSDQSTRAMAVFLDTLKSTTVEFNDKTHSGADLWQHLFKIVGTLVGGIDDLNIAEVDGAVNEALGDAFDLAGLDDDDQVKKIRDEIEKLRNPKIASTTLASNADKVAETKGLRVLGQVYLPDSQTTDDLVWEPVGADEKKEGWETEAEYCKVDTTIDSVDLTPEEMHCICDEAFSDFNTPAFWDLCRGIPSGLDVAASLSGNADIVQLAENLFGGYAGYTDSLTTLVEMFNNYTEKDWSKSVAWTWLYAIRGLFTGAENGKPPFMRTDRWKNKGLETGLSAWAEMRHDTILYAKQSYTSDADADGDGDVDTDTDTEPDVDFDYVEPQPETYSRLAAGAKRLQKLIDDDNVFQDSTPVREQLTVLITLLDTATEISLKELEGKALSNADITWIRESGFNMGAQQGPLLYSLDIIDDNMEPDPDRLRTPVIADVHTFGDKKVVLEVGTGNMAYTVILHQIPSGEWGVAVGPTMTYHEFEQKMSNRLTDEEWRDMLKDDPSRGQPEWLEGP